MWSIIGGRFPHRLARILLKVIILIVTTMAGLNTSIQDRSNDYNDQESNSPGIEQSSQNNVNDASSNSGGDVHGHDKTYLHPTEKPGSSAADKERGTSFFRIEPELKQGIELQRIKKPSVECKINYSKSKIKKNFKGESKLKKIGVIIDY